MAVQLLHPAERELRTSPLDLIRALGERLRPEDLAAPTALLTCYELLLANRCGSAKCAVISQTARDASVATRLCTTNDVALQLEELLYDQALLATRGTISKDFSERICTFPEVARLRGLQEDDSVDWLAPCFFDGERTRRERIRELVRKVSAPDHTTTASEQEPLLLLLLQLARRRLDAPRDPKGADRTVHASSRFALRDPDPVADRTAFEALFRNQFTMHNQHSKGRDNFFLEERDFFASGSRSVSAALPAKDMEALEPWPSFFRGDEVQDRRLVGPQGGNEHSIMARARRSLPRLRLRLGTALPDYTLLHETVPVSSPLRDAVVASAQLALQGIPSEMFPLKSSHSRTGVAKWSICSLQARVTCFGKIVQHLRARATCWSSFSSTYDFSGPLKHELKAVESIGEGLKGILWNEYIQHVQGFGRQRDTTTQTSSSSLLQLWLHLQKPPVRWDSVLLDLLQFSSIVDRLLAKVVPTASSSRMRLEDESAVLASNFQSVLEQAVETWATGYGSFGSHRATIADRVAKQRDVDVVNERPLRRSAAVFGPSFASRARAVAAAVTTETAEREQRRQAARAQAFRRQRIGSANLLSSEAATESHLLQTAATAHRGSYDGAQRLLRAQRTRVFMRDKPKREHWGRTAAERAAFDTKHFAIANPMAHNERDKSDALLQETYHSSEKINNAQAALGLEKASNRGASTKTPGSSSQSRTMERDGTAAKMPDFASEFCAAFSGVKAESEFYFGGTSSNKLPHEQGDDRSTALDSLDSDTDSVESGGATATAGDDLADTLGGEAARAAREREHAARVAERDADVAERDAKKRKQRQLLDEQMAERRTEVLAAEQGEQTVPQLAQEVNILGQPLSEREKRDRAQAAAALLAEHDRQAAATAYEAARLEWRRKRLEGRDRRLEIVAADLATSLPGGPPSMSSLQSAKREIDGVDNKGSTPAAAAAPQDEGTVGTGQEEIIARTSPPLNMGLTTSSIAALSSRGLASDAEAPPEPAFSVRRVSAKRISPTSIAAKSVLASIYDRVVCDADQRNEEDEQVSRNQCQHGKLGAEVGSEINTPNKGVGVGEERRADQEVSKEEAVVAEQHSSTPRVDLADGEKNFESSSEASPAVEQKEELPLEGEKKKPDVLAGHDVRRVSSATSSAAPLSQTPLDEKSQQGAGEVPRGDRRLEVEQETHRANLTAATARVEDPVSKNRATTLGRKRIAEAEEDSVVCAPDDESSEESKECFLHPVIARRADAYRGLSLQIRDLNEHFCKHENTKSTSGRSSARAEQIMLTEEGIGGATTLAKFLLSVDFVGWVDRFVYATLDDQSFRSAHFSSVGTTVARLFQQTRDSSAIFSAERETHPRTAGKIDQFNAAPLELVLRQEAMIMVESPSELYSKMQFVLPENYKLVMKESQQTTSSSAPAHLRRYEHSRQLVILSGFFQLLCRVKAAREELRTLWLWLCKHPLWVDSRLLKTSSGRGVASSQDAAQQPPGVPRAKDFVKSLLLKLGLLRHHMQHYVDQLEEYLVLAVWTEAIADTRGRIKEAKSNKTTSCGPVAAAPAAQLAFKANHVATPATASGVAATPKLPGEDLLPGRRASIKKTEDHSAATARAASSGAGGGGGTAQLPRSFLLRDQVEQIERDFFEQVKARILFGEGIFDAPLELIAKLRYLITNVSSDQELVRGSLLYQLKQVDSNFHKCKKALRLRLKQPDIKVPYLAGLNLI
ncbi:unnamed protein product [Amoebophrya sp. A120]|nr:unnamed protein product [Amoebophrya sp. A120]|eukprot:GSA120T00001821001.1